MGIFYRTLSYFKSALASIEEAPLKPPLDLSLYVLLVPQATPEGAVEVISPPSTSPFIIYT